MVRKREKKTLFRWHGDTQEERNGCPPSSREEKERGALKRREGLILSAGNFLEGGKVIEILLSKPKPAMLSIMEVYHEVGRSRSRPKNSKKKTDESLLYQSLIEGNGSPRGGGKKGIFLQKEGRITISDGHNCQSEGEKREGEKAKVP